jgi:hypothetical protein
MEAEIAAATARQRQEEAEEARAKATAARESDAPAAEQTKLNRKVETAAAKAKAARERAIEVAKEAGLEPLDLEPLAVEAMPRRGLARKANVTPARKTQRNFTHLVSHVMQSGGSYPRGYNCQVAVDSGHQVIVAVGVSNQPPDVEHLEPMLQRITATADALPEVMTMDAGYWSEGNAKGCSDQGIEAPSNSLMAQERAAWLALMEHRSSSHNIDVVGMTKLIASGVDIFNHYRESTPRIPELYSQISEDIQASYYTQSLRDLDYLLTKIKKPLNSRRCHHAIPCKGSILR